MSVKVLSTGSLTGESQLSDCFFSYHIKEHFLFFLNPFRLPHGIFSSFFFSEDKFRRKKIQKFRRKKLKKTYIQQRRTKSVRERPNNSLIREVASKGCLIRLIRLGNCSRLNPVATLSFLAAIRAS